MKTALPYLCFVSSISFAVMTFLSPWATSAYQIAGTNQQIAAPVSFLNPWVMVNGCPRGSAEGQDSTLDIWLSVGRSMMLTQIGLWLAFVFSLFHARRRAEGILWIVGLALVIPAILAIGAPIIECLTIARPPLVYLNRWQINGASVLLSLTSMVFGVYANVYVRRVGSGRPLLSATQDIVSA